MTDDGGDDLYTPAQYREHQEGHGIREPFAYDHAGLTRDARLSRYIATIQQEYDPETAAPEEPEKMPGRAADLDMVRRPLRMEATDVARNALEEGDTQTLKHLTGDADQRADVSGMKAIQKVDELITGPAPVIIILGEMGTGKTDFAGLLGQRFQAHAEGELAVGSNIKSLRERTEWTDPDGEEQDGYIPNYPTLKDWVEQDGDPLHNDQQRKLFVGDEFSISASGHGSSGHQTATKMGPLIYLIRKYNGALIYIAHGEKSIHPLMWRVGTIVKKQSKKKAVVADRIKGAQLADRRFEMEGVPPTDWRFNTDEASSWSWYRTTDDVEELESEEVARRVAIWTVVRCKEEGMSNRETAQYVPYSHGWVGSRWREYTEEKDHRETVSSVEAIVA